MRTGEKVKGGNGDFLKLSAAQRKILTLIGEGRMTKEIAAEMHISEKGVEYHRGVIYRTLGIQSLAEAVRLATRTNAVSAYSDN